MFDCMYAPLCCLRVEPCAPCCIPGMCGHSVCVFVRLSLVWLTRSAGHGCAPFPDSYPCLCDHRSSSFALFMSRSPSSSPPALLLLHEFPSRSPSPSLSPPSSPLSSAVGPVCIELLQDSWTSTRARNVFHCLTLRVIEMSTRTIHEVLQAAPLLRRLR